MSYLYHLCIEFKSLFRSKNELFISYFFPILFSLFTGYVMIELNPAFKTTFIMSMVIFSVLCVTLLMIPGQIIQGRDAGIFKCYHIYGIKKVNIIGLYILPGMVHVFILTLVIGFLSPCLFHVQPIEQAGQFIILIFIYYLINAYLSVVIGAVAPKNGTATMISLIFFLPTLLLGGVMLPVDSLPESFRGIAGFIPSQSIMKIYLNYQQLKDIFSFIVLAGWLIITVVLAHILFKGNKKTIT